MMLDAKKKSEEKTKKPGNSEAKEAGARPAPVYVEEIAHAQ
jgi:hypothetical protein